MVGFFDIEKLEEVELLLETENPEDVLHFVGTELGLTFLPSSFQKLVNLESLNLSENKFVSFPTDICDLPNLKVLILNEANISEIPSEICRLQNTLEQISLASNNLKELPSTFEKLLSLQTLNLSANDFQTFPREVVKLLNLKTVYISDNKIKEIPPEIGQLKFLNTLKMDGNSLENVPHTFELLQNLKRLDFAFNNFEFVSIRIFKCRALETLHFNDNQLLEFSHFAGQLSSLERLYLSWNKLDSLSAGICNMSNLIALQINSNQIKSVSDQIYKLTALEELQMVNNKIRSLPASIGKLASLKVLDLTANMLTEIPRSLCKLRNLQDLNLSNNCIKNLPNNVGSMENLQCLHLDSNDIVNIPETICTLRRLEVLGINKNDLESVPKELCSVKSLEQCYFSGNKIKSLPEQIGRLSNLRVLSVCINKLCRLPDSICKLENLEMLLVHTNDIDHLPQEIGNLQRLVRLDVHNNKMCQLPLSFVRLCHFQQPQDFFEYHQNNFKDPPTYIIEKGLDKIKEYLEDSVKLKSTLETFPQVKGLHTIGASLDGDTSVIVVHVDDEYDEKYKYQQHGDFRVHYYKYNRPSSDAYLASTSRIQEEHPLNTQEMKLLRNAINKHECQLFKQHTNLTMISGSPVKMTKGTIKREPCVVFYCQTKGVIPRGEGSFPTSIDGLKTDVMEGYYRDLLSDVTLHQEQAGSAIRNQFQDILNMGCCIGRVGGNQHGSLGGFVVQIDDWAKSGFITCGHIFYTRVSDDTLVNVPHEPRQDDRVSQPGCRGEDQCGRICKQVIGTRKIAVHSGQLVEIGIDATYVETSSRHPHDSGEGITLCVTDEECKKLAFPHNLNFNQGHFLTFEQTLDTANVPEYANLFKCGLTTGLTKGTINFVGTVTRKIEMLNLPVSLAEDRGRFTVIRAPNQIQISGQSGTVFCDRGDSGSMVFGIEPNIQRPVVIGMAIGIMEPTKFAIVTPIEPILRELGVSFFNLDTMEPTLAYT